MFPSIVASPVVSSLNHPWLQGRGRRDVLMRSPPPSCTPPPLLHPIPIMGETPGKNDESDSLPVRTKGVFQVVFKVVYFIHSYVCLHLDPSVFVVLSTRECIFLNISSASMNWRGKEMRTITPFDSDRMHSISFKRTFLLLIQRCLLKQRLAPSK